MTEISWFKQRFGELLRPVIVQGDRPLLLDDPSCAYVTLSEHHQLFSVGYRDGQPYGRREHLAVCEPGQLLFGVVPEVGQGATALLLSGVSGSTVWQVPMAALFSLGDDGPLARLIDRWVELLIGTLPHSQVPSGSHSVAAGATCSGSADRPVYAREGVVWVTTLRAPQIYRGIQLAELHKVAAAWPLTSDAWLLGDEDELRGLSTETLLTTETCAQYVASFSAFANAVAAERRVALAASRLQGDARSLRAEVDNTAAALTQLAQLSAASPLQPEGALERACLSVFRELGLEELPVVSPPTSYTLPDIQIALSNVSGVRTRTVKLDATLCNADAGPLLAFVPGEGDRVQPVALVPRGSGGYCVAEKLLTPRDLASLHPEAQQFYRPFPARALSAWGLVRFAASGLRADALRILFAGLAFGLIGTLLPLLTGRVYDEIIPAAERRYLWQLLAVLLAVFAGSALFELSRSLLLLRVQTRMDVSVEAGTWDRLLSLPLPFFRDYAAGDLADRAEGIGTLRELLAEAGLSALLACIFSVWNFALLFVYDVTLALAATVLVAVAALVALLSTYAELGYQRTLSALDGRMSGLLLQLMGGIAKLRSSGSENRAFAVWARLFARRRDVSLAAGRVDVRVSVFEAMYPLLCSMCLFWLMARSRAGALTTGQFLAFSAAFALFMRAVLALVSALLQVVKAVPLFERARPILTSPVESRGAADRRVQLRGAIELSHVSFRYEPSGPLTLDDVSLQIAPGEFVAIVGPSGSGKSTLLRLLLGFAQPTEGAVFYDGQALAGMDLRKVRRQIGVVLQHSQVMAGDIFSNIVGNIARKPETAWRAARQAAFAHDIEQMPMGMHTVLAQGGGALSGGQRQRLLIARALASDPRLLFFDEATSALDNRTQAEVSASLDQLRMTRVVIAHRLSTIRHADRIVVLERGKIVQLGSFESLLQQGGTFADLVSRQLV
jgi:NHLM bacteriocin system ABC transporter ATP-binding protein